MLFNGEHCKQHFSPTLKTQKPAGITACRMCLHANMLACKHVCLQTCLLTNMLAYIHICISSNEHSYKGKINYKMRKALFRQKNHYAGKRFLCKPSRLYGAAIAQQKIQRRYRAGNDEQDIDTYHMKNSYLPTSRHKRYLKE